MGSRAEASYKELVKRLLRWPGMRERPEGDTPFGRSCARPSLRMNGARFATFHLDEGRRLHVAFRIPPSLAEEVPEAARAPEGHLEARVDLSAKGGLERAEELARRLYEVRTGKAPP